MSTSTVLTDRLSSHRPFRASLTLAGTAVLGLSLLLSVAPVLGAANNGNGNGADGHSSNGGVHGTSGNVKVHDAGTGVEAAGNDNEPHVCAFWLSFAFDAPFEAGTWELVSWAPTGDGSTVASGVYDTAGDGVDTSGILALVAGHYRVEWSATGATSSKKKTFWVDACNEVAPIEESQAEEPAPPSDQPSSPAEESQPEESQVEASQPEESQAEESQADESQAEDQAPPTDAADSPTEESQAEGSQAEEETPPTDAADSPTEESQAEEDVLAGDGSAPEGEESQPEEAASTDDEDATSEEESADEEIAPADPTDAEEATQEEEPAATDPVTADHEATDPGAPPAQDELGSVSEPSGPAMADTAVPAVPARGGALATIAVLMLILGHAAMRRDRASDREIL